MKLTLRVENYSDIKERMIVEKTINWCIDKLQLTRFHSLKLRVKLDTIEECYGYCQQIEEREYIIAIDNKQSLRNFIMTIIHEMIHIKQFLTGKWNGDGEDEAETLQEELTDELWGSDIL
tara:strand:+ start:1481 stop:1840 length:360 start_codon:yes stop_codon:yes gene_type:complete